VAAALFHALVRRDGVIETMASRRHQPSGGRGQPKFSWAHRIDFD
jgi:hypothetical protein